jgi:hypothetical protein
VAPAQHKPTRIHVIPVGAALGAYFANGILGVALIVFVVLLGVTAVWVISPTVYLTIIAWGLNRR